MSGDDSDEWVTAGTGGKSKSNNRRLSQSSHQGSSRRVSQGGGRGGGDSGRSARPTSSQSFSTAGAANRSGRGGGFDGGRGGGAVDNGRCEQATRSLSFTATGTTNRSARGGGGGRGTKDRSKSFTTPRQNSHKSVGGSGNRQQQQQQQQNEGGRSVRRNRSMPVASDANHSNSSGQKSNNNPKDNKKGGEPKLKRYRAPDAVLLLTTGSGETPEKRNVIRSGPEIFFARRMHYLDAPPVAVMDADNREHHGWSPYEKCLWTDDKEDRIHQIQEEMKIYFDYKPLDVNDQTRWKAKVMHGDDARAVTDQQAEQIRRAIAILNKLSWTTLDKLTVKFLEALGAPTTITTGASSSGSNAGDSDDGSCGAVLSKDVVRESMTLVVEKAVNEPHFSELYAHFCTKLTNAHKAFRRALLPLCQKQFEESDKEPADLPEDEIARKRKLLLLKKRSIGLMKFIGELYKMKLIKGNIMVSCLVRLLQPNDEEKVECYAQLMTTVGARLHHTVTTEPEAAEGAAQLETLWKQTYSMAGRKYSQQQVEDVGDGPQSPSNRIKFLLQDLIELKEHDWISQRRQEEKAKTIAEIHKSVAREEEEAARRSRSTPMRSHSFTSASKGGSSDIKPNMAAPINRASVSVPDDNGFAHVPAPPRKSSLQRAKSDQVQMSSLYRSAAGDSQAMSGFSPTRRSGMPKHQEGSSSQHMRSPSEVLTESKIVEYVEPEECGDKMKSLLKYYFVGGDMDDAVSSIEDLVGMGDEGHVARGAAVVRAGVLLVMEMKEDDVRKFQKLMARCLDEDKIDKESIVLGLEEPLDCLRDIEIDAPLAGSFLADIVASWIKVSILSFDFFLQAPDFFKTDGKPALFAAQVLKKCGGELSDAQVEVVDTLMTEEEKKSAVSPRDWIQSKIS